MINVLLIKRQLWAPPPPPLFVSAIETVTEASQERWEFIIAARKSAHLTEHYLLTSRSLDPGESATSIEWVIAASLMTAIAQTVAAVVVPIRISLKSLESMRT